MDIRNCKRCNRLFQYNGIKYCPSCVMELDEMFKKVRDYLYEHPDATIIEVSEATGVEEKIILEFLREGRLELKEPSPVLTCERCGKPITTGRMCKECLAVFERGLKKGLSESARKVSDLKPDSSKIHLADYIIKKRDRE
ncbi:MerR family transcriptional regulator [Caldicoprobacter faecalis]|uniref:Flagellar operon protein TIGR03826 n=1 Tax=Caldicoprobacter faecalis TaxID=937334 RepID=A0A1I5V7Q7_9FIRM|nr:MerR family transcriptional regulator [Caldicoprobacter faecalis]SFQ02976.1 flagellar operon protein TIGR03826 [Caldicoprobacter faecalis]